MVDEFMVCVDRIQVVTSSAAACLEQSSSSSFLVVNSGEIGRQLQQEEEEEEETKVGKEKEGVGENVTSKNGIFGVGVEVGSSNLLKAKGSLIRECRICQEEDDESHLEAPCACNGTLKFAHRKCIQRWCNKKGDITCEICNQLFSPNYTSPPPKSTSDVMAIDIRQAWGPHIDLRDPRFLAFAAAERQFLQSEYDDYAIANTGTLSCFRSVAIILMLLLLIRQTLMLTRDFGMLQESSFFHYQISVLQLAGFLLPCYVVARSWYFVQCRRRRQG